MKDKPDFLTGFTDDKKSSHRTAYRLLMICYCCQFAIAMLVFVASLRMYRISATTIMGNNILLTQLAFTRGLPLITLILLSLKKKAGWYLGVCLSVINLIKKAIFAFSIIQLALNSPAAVSLITQTANILLLVLSLANVILLLSPVLRQMFAVRLQATIVTVVIAIGIFLLLKFYVAGLVLNSLKSR